MLDERSGDIDQLIVSTRQTMQNVDDIVATFKEKEGAISDMIDGGREIVLKADTIMTRGVEIATAVDPLKVEQVVSSLGSFADGLNASLTRVDELVASVDPQQVSEAVDKVSTIIDNFNNQQGQINEIIASTKSTIQNFEQVSATVRGQDDRIAALITDVQRAADRFATTLETAEGLLEAVDPEKGRQYRRLRRDCGRGPGSSGGRGSGNPEERAQSCGRCAADDGGSFQADA
ncbi:hypothetical protein QW131_14085 [Roseibium salinum]|nr:hypothetical protein [Roseibium salinum]